MGGVPTPAGQLRRLQQGLLVSTAVGLRTRTKLLMGITTTTTTTTTLGGRRWMRIPSLCWGLHGLMRLWGGVVWMMHKREACLHSRSRRKGMCVVGRGRLHCGRSCSRACVVRRRGCLALDR